MKANNKIKKRYLLTSLIIGVLSVLSVFVFNFLYKYDQGIIPPNSKYDVPFEVFSINSNEKTQLIMENGTMLDIPMGAFEDENGNEVTGKIDLKFRQFHDPVSIFQSGITMSIDANRKDFLMSSGMMELRAFQNGKELALRNGKNINLELANLKDTDDYELYYLENDQNWAINGTFTSGVNIRKQMALDTLQEIPDQPKDPEHDTTSFFFELQVDIKKFPSLKQFSERKWKMIRPDGDTSYPWGLRVNWDKVDFKLVDKKELLYELTFSKLEIGTGGIKRKTSCKILATPELAGDRLRKAKNEFLAELQEYDQIKEKVNQELSRLEKEADLVNKFNINQMGVWNIDKIMDKAMFVMVDARFDVEDKINPFFNEIKLYCIYEDLNSVVVFKPIDWSKLMLPQNGKAKIVLVLPDDKVAVVDLKDNLRWKENISTPILFKTQIISFEDFIADNNYNVKPSF